MYNYLTYIKTFYMLLLYRTTASEIVFWILFLGMAFDCNIHWTYLILPGIISSITSLLNYNKPNNND